MLINSYVFYEQMYFMYKNKRKVLFGLNKIYSNMVYYISFNECYYLLCNIKGLVCQLYGSSLILMLDRSMLNDI